MRASLAALALVALAARAGAQEVIKAEPADAFDAFVAANKAKLPQKGAEGIQAWGRHASALSADCAKGSDLACALLPDVYRVAASLAREDRKTALSLLEKPCQGGDLIQCALAGEALDDPGGTSNETPRAIERLVAACKQGATQACLRAAWIRLGAGIDHPALSETEARAQLELACARGFPEGCELPGAFRGAYVPGTYAQTPLLAADARACRVGSRPACRQILTNIAPERPFGCSRCKERKLDTGEEDDRCLDCWLAACRREHCCPTCKDRDSYACCGDDGVPHPQPEVAPPLDPAVTRRAAEIARRTTARARAIWQAGCQRGLREWCQGVAELDGILSKLEQPPAP